MERTKPEILTWDEVKDAAEELFSVWTDGQDLVWAEKAWKILVEAGLPIYTTQYGRCRAGLYLLGLSSLYADFCGLAFQEMYTPNYPDAADLLGITPFRLGQIVATDPDFLDSDDDVFYEALETYAEEQRSAIYGPLIRSYGSCLDFYNELWRTVEGLPDKEEDEELAISQADLYNLALSWSVSESQVRVYGWIADGCYSVF
jgi:hypothetical protein